MKMKCVLNFEEIKPGCIFSDAGNFLIRAFVQKILKCFFVRNFLFKILPHY